MFTRIKRSLFCVASLLYLVFSASAEVRDIDLTARDAWVRKGFAFEWTYYQPEAGDSAWTRIPAKPGNRPLIMRDLDLVGGTTRKFLRFGPGKIENYCVIIPFEAGADLVESSTGIGLYLSYVGQNWDVYLNGSIIHNESFIDRNGRIARDRSLRGALVSVDRRYLKAGQNILAFQIYGDPSDDRTGFSSGGPYILGDYQRLLERRVEYADLMLIGIYFFFGLYHVFLFLLRRKNQSYLLYGVGTLLLSIYLFTRTVLVFSIFPNAATAKALELFSLFLLLPVFLGFFDVLSRGKISLFTWIYSALFGFAAFCVPFFWQEPLLMAWQYTTPVPLVYLLVFDLGIPIAKAFAAAWNGALAGKSRVFAGLRAAFIDSDEGKLFLGALVMAGTIALDIAAANSGSLNSYSKYGFLVIVFGIASVLASQLERVYREIENFTTGLEGKVRGRTAELDKTLEVQSELTGRLAEAHDRLERMLEVTARDTRIAVQVQQGFFPREAPATIDWDAAFVFLPASGVSGDFYDFYLDGLSLKGVALGDVSGHGVASGLITVLTRSVFLRHFRELEKKPLGLVIESANAELQHELAAVENYLTAALLRFSGDTVEYANAAHPDIAFRRDGKARANLIKPPAESYKASPLGREGIGGSCKSMKFALRSGDSILMYTDFLIAAPDDEGKPFGIDGMLDAYGRAPEGRAADMLQFIMEEWRFHRHGAPQTDDFSAILLRRK